MFKDGYVIFTFEVDAPAKKYYLTIRNHKDEIIAFKEEINAHHIFTNSASHDEAMNEAKKRIRQALESWPGLLEWTELGPLPYQLLNL